MSAASSTSRGTSTCLGVPVLALALACGGPIPRGEPLVDLDLIAQADTRASGTTTPMRVVFEWEYADERGNLRGQGSGRVNPPDRFRLDLFSTAEGSMRAVLVDDLLASSGDLEGVRLPPPAFLYAMAGVFRPGPARPIEGFQSDAFEVLGYPVEDGSMRYFYLLDGRLQRVEDLRSRRTQRRIELTWGENPTWPREAVYRDDITPSRVRWELVRMIPQDEPFPEEIYDRASTR